MLRQALRLELNMNVACHRLRSQLGLLPEQVIARSSRIRTRTITRGSFRPRATSRTRTISSARMRKISFESGAFLFWLRYLPNPRRLLPLRTPSCMLTPLHLLLALVVWVSVALVVCVSDACVWGCG